MKDEFLDKRFQQLAKLVGAALAKQWLKIMASALNDVPICQAFDIEMGTDNRNHIEVEFLPFRQHQKSLQQTEGLLISPY